MCSAGGVPLAFTQGDFLVLNGFNTGKNVLISQNFNFRKNNSARRPYAPFASGFPKKSDLIRCINLCEAGVRVRSSVITDTETVRPGFAIVVTSAYCTSGTISFRCRVREN